MIRVLIIMSASYALAVAADVVTTRAAIARGAGNESNLRYVDENGSVRYGRYLFMSLVTWGAGAAVTLLAPYPFGIIGLVWLRAAARSGSRLPSTTTGSGGRHTMGITSDPNDPGLRETREDGQQGSYLVLSDEERAKGFVRPVRDTYKHLSCGAVTTMPPAIAETYARDPEFYTGTFCTKCRRHYDLVDSTGRRAFVWQPDGSAVGT